MTQHSDSCELQQLVQKEESEEPLNRGGEATPPSTPARSNEPSDGETLSSRTLVVLFPYLLYFYSNLEILIAELIL
jgi:hypothetical protein